MLPEESPMTLPLAFCWSRYGTEAGETFASIIARKELERRSNAGTFLWGIGSALGPSMQALLASTCEPTVAFSPIRSRPRERDVCPGEVVTWTAGHTLSGERFPLPTHSIVRSRFDPSRAHYALVCYSRDAIDSEKSAAQVALRQVCNILSGRPIGASQVTAVVKRQEGGDQDGPVYPVTIIAELRAPFFIRLTEYAKVERVGRAA